MIPSRISRSFTATMVHFLLIAATVALGTPLAASQDSSKDDAAAAKLSQTLAEHQLSLHLENGRLQGPGAEALGEASRKARYVLLGEDHGLDSVLGFSQAFLRMLHPLGFETYVTEIGPESAEQVLRLLDAEDPMAAFADFYASYPFSIPFATYLREVELLRQVADRATVENPIWGIDQEFFLSPQLLLTELASLAPEKLRSRLESMAVAEAEAFRAVVASGNPSTPTFMTRPLPADWPELLRAFPAGSEGHSLVAELEHSHRIYGHFYAGRYHLNNADRAQLMKTHLRQYLERHGRDRRLVVKLGANHVARGWSPLGISDIGNLMAELAAFEGEDSLHILLVAASGYRNAWLPFLPAETQRMAIETEGRGPLVDALPHSDGWSVIDLRPLHGSAARWAKVDPELPEILRRYDIVVRFDVTEPAELVSTLKPDSKPDSKQEPSR